MLPVTMDEVERLRALANIDAAQAHRRAQVALQEGSATGEVIAGLRWVRGLALREMGQLEAAFDELAAAVSLAIDGGFVVLAAKVKSSLAHLRARRGDLDGATRLLREAAPFVEGDEHARVIGQLGTIAFWTGDLDLASRLLRDAIDELDGSDGGLAEARYRANLGAVLGMTGSVPEGTGHLRRSIELADRGGFDFVSGMARANLGFVETLAGDLPEALRHFGEAEPCYRRATADSVLPRLHADHAQALADAGLFSDAETLVRQAIEMYREQGQETELAGVLLTSASIRLAASDASGAVTAAEEAEAKFRSQDRASWAGVAHSLALQAAARLDTPPADLADQLEASADLLRSHEWGAEAARAQLVALKLRAEQGRPSPVAAQLRTVVEHGRSADQILLAHVDALAASDPTAARNAVERGLRIATTAQAGLGSIETRAHAAAHGHELVELGARLAIGAGRPRELLARIEATRIMSSRLPSVRPPADAEMASLLAELRSVEAKLADPSDDLDQRRELEAQASTLERQVRRRSRTVRGDGAVVDFAAEIGDAIELLGDRQLVAHAALDGRLHAVTVVEGEAALHDLGDLAGVREQVEAVAFSLNRLNRAQGSDASRLAAAEMLFGLADELSELLLPPDVAESFEPVVIVPTAVLHDVPWGLLPPLGGRPVAVNASLTGWARATRSRLDRATPTALRAGFVAGPGLEFAELETKELASYYPGAVTLGGVAATGERCLDLFGHSDLVHVACHGSFRNDNPLFSSIHVADGPLNVYDFERPDRLPDTIVLSACSVAGSKALQGGSLLGLATALTTLGACTVIAPLTPISDASAVTVMQRLHQAIVAGASPTDALAAATLTHDVADPTAAAFVALGA